MQCAVFKDFSANELTRLINEFLRKNRISRDKIFQILQSSGGESRGETTITIFYT